MYWVLWKQFMDGMAANPPAPRASKRRGGASHSVPARSNNDDAMRLDDRDLIGILLDHGGQAVCIVCPEAGALKISTNWQAITGTNAGEQEGEAFFERLHPQHAGKFRRRLHEFLRDGKPGSARYQVRHGDGSWRWVEFTLSRALGKAVVCLGRDVTDETQDRQKLHKTMQESELAFKARSEFLAHLSHELRTPLNAILGFTQMIEHKLYGNLGDARYDDYMQNIKESGNTLLSKLNDLFEIAYIDAGYTTLAEESVAVSDLFAQAIEILSHHAFSQQVKIHAPASSLVIRADRLKLLKVLLCLLSNAIKFNRSEGEVTLSAELHRVKGLMIAVADTGKGIAGRQLAHIQTVLNHEESFLARDRDHAGTGLALAGELVRMHGGSIEVETELGEGSHFAVILPRERLLRGQQAKKIDKPRAEVA